MVVHIYATRGVDRWDYTLNKKKECDMIVTITELQLEEILSFTDKDIQKFLNVLWEKRNAKNK